MSKFKKYQPEQAQDFILDVRAILPEEHMVYFIESCVSRLDTSSLESKYSDLGQSGFHPKMMLSILFYGYIKGIRSGRKLAAACEENIAFIYLSKNYCPKKTAINNFRHQHYESFKPLFKEVLGLFKKSERDGSTSIFDGSKFKANASKKRTKTEAKYEKWSAVLDEDLKEIEEELSREQSNEKIALLSKEKSKREYLREKIEEVKKMFTTEEKDELINLTDTDACFQKGKKGNFDLFYNVQVGCNEQQVILYTEVCTDKNDRQQLIPGIKGVEENTGEKVEKGLADAGYSSFDNMEYMKDNEIIGYVPDQDFGKTFKDKPYHKYHFKKDEEKDQLICPQGKILEYWHKRKDGKNTFHVYKGTACENCPVKADCTSGKVRSVRIEVREPLRQEMRERLQTDEGRAMYKKRLHPVEAIFGHLVFNLGYNNFLLRGLDKVKAEFQLMCIGYNLMKLFNKDKGVVLQKMRFLLLDGLRHTNIVFSQVGRGNFELWYYCYS